MIGKEIVRALRCISTVCNATDRNCPDCGYFRKWFGCDVDRLSKDAADAVPVVRCRDCEYYKNHPNGLCYLHTEPKANRQGYSGEAVCVEPDDFCSYGLRKGGNDNVSG